MSGKHAHSELIDAVGARIIASHFKLSPQRLHAWRKRGIPYACRPEFAKIAAVHSATLPSDFFAAPGMAA